MDTKTESVDEKPKIPAHELAKIERITERVNVVSGLVANHRRWLIRYLFHGNATKAAGEVGYAHPNKAGPRLLKLPKIKAAIEEYFHREEMSAKEAVAILSRQARGDMEDFIHFPTGNDGEDILYLEPEISLRKARKRGKLPLIKKFKKKRTTRTDNDGNETIDEWTEIEPYDAQAAAVQIAKIHGLYGARGTEDDPVHNVGMTVDEWRAEREKRHKQAAATMALFDDEEE